MFLILPRRAIFLLWRRKESPLRYEIAFDANTTAVERDVTLTFEGLNASDVSFSPAVTTSITLNAGGRAYDDKGGECD